MDFLTVFEEKLSVSAATISQEHNIMAKINESLLYKRFYGNMDSLFYFEIYTYQNGYPNQSLLSVNGTFYETNEVYLIVNISCYQGDEAGEYFIIVYTLPHILFFDYGCDEYYEFVVIYLSLFSPIWQVQKVQMHTTGNSFVHTVTVCVLCLVLSPWLVNLM